MPAVMYHASPTPREVYMRSLLSLVFSLALAVSSLAQTPPSPSVTVIRAGVLIDGKSNQPRRDQLIIIRGNRIESRGRGRRQNNRGRRHDRPIALDGSAWPD